MDQQFKLGDLVAIKSDGTSTGEALAAMPLLYVVRAPSRTDVVPVGPRLDGDGSRLGNDRSGYWNIKTRDVTSLVVLNDAELAKAIEDAANELRARNVKAAECIAARASAITEEAEKQRKIAEAKAAALSKLSPEGQRLFKLFSEKKEIFGCQTAGAIEFFGTMLGDDLAAALDIAVSK